MESASFMPSNQGVYSGKMAVTPAYAESTCSHNPYFLAIANISRKGSLEVVEVVPMVATIAQGLNPAVQSA